MLAHLLLRYSAGGKSKHRGQVYTLNRFFVSTNSVDLTTFIPVRCDDGLTQICLCGLPRWDNLNHSTRSHGQPEIISSQQAHAD